MTRAAKFDETVRPASLQEVYVDRANGLDTNPGTKSMPFATINAALASIPDASAVKRYAVVCAPGNYAENVLMIPWVSLVGAAYGVDSVNIEPPAGRCIEFPAAMGGNPAAVENMRLTCPDPAPGVAAVFSDNGGNGTLRNCTVTATGGGRAVEIGPGGLLLAYDCAGLALADTAAWVAGGGGFVGGSWTGDGVQPDIDLQATAVVILTPDVQLGNLTVAVAPGAAIQPRNTLHAIQCVELNPANWVPAPNPTPDDMVQALDRIAAAVAGLLAAPIP